MSSLLEMKKERFEALTACEQIISRAEAAKRELTTEEKSVFDSHMAVATSLQPRIERSESLNTIRQFDPVALLSGRLVKPGEPDAHDEPQPHGPSQPKVGNALRAAMHTGTAEEREYARSFAQYLAGDMTALADLSPTGDGSVFIPTVVSGMLTRNYAQFAPVVGVCTLFPTATGEPTKFPVVSDVESAEQLDPAAVTGADAVVSGDTPLTEVGGPTMLAYKISSKPVFVPRETLTDSTVEVLNEIVSALVARIIRFENLRYTKGTGNGQAEGFLTNCTPFTSSAPLDLDVALDLAYSVPALYRPTGVYMASDTTVKYLRKLKTGISGDKRSLWKEAFEEGNATLGTPAKLHGWPLYVNNDMDNVASNGTFAGVSPLAFGDFKRFVVRQAEQATPYIYRFPVPAKDGGAAIAFRRSDSRLLVPVAIARLVQSGS